MDTSIDTAMVVVTLATGLWWGFARRRRQNLLQTFSIAALALSVATLVVEGLRWQLVPWHVLAVAVAAAAGFRRWRPGRSRRWRRVHRTRRARRRSDARWAGAPDGVGAGAASAVGPA